MTERQKKALELKGNHRIFLFREAMYVKAILGGTLSKTGNEELLSAYDIVDADEVNMTEEKAKDWKENPDHLIIPDYTPDWLRNVVDCFDNVYEEFESLFNFPDDDTIREFKEICDFVIDEE